MLKTILYRPTDQTGLGNRLRGLALCYAISLATGRRLVVEDYLITEYFSPPDGVDWKPFQELHKRKSGSWRVLAMNLSPENWDQTAYDSYQTRDLNSVFQEDVLEVVQGASFIDALRTNPHYQKLWQSYGMDPQNALEWMGRLVERLLARPKKKLVNAAQKLRQKVGWDKTNAQRIGIQYRTFYDIGSPHLKAVTDFIQMLSERLPLQSGPLWFYLTTDDPAATAQLEAFLGSHGQVVTSGKRKVVHSGYSYEGWSEVVFKIFRKLWPRLKPHRFDLWKLVPMSLRFRPQTQVFAEWFLLGECRVLYSTFTTFSEFAAARNGNRASLVRFDPETGKTEQLKSITYEPLISVVTVSFNSLSGLKLTHASLPSDPDFEYLLVDGNSQDGTAEFLLEPGLKYQRIVQETDKGIYDAMNKGIRLARGQFIIFMNCGDRFLPDIPWDLVKAELTKSEAVHIGSLEIDGGGRMVIDSPQLRPSSFFRISLPHQAAFIPRRFFLQQGGYREVFSITADQEWFFRTLKQGLAYRALPYFIASYQGNGVSDQNANRVAIVAEKARFLGEGYGIAYLPIFFWFQVKELLWTALRDWFRLITGKTPR